MTLTFLDLYNECAGQPWSMFDNDANTVEDFESSMRISINQALSVLWNLQPWSFRIEKMSTNTKQGRANYGTPNGELLKKTVRGITRYGIKCNGKFLSYEPGNEYLEETETGEPESFYISADTIYLYPVPDNSYKLEISYLTLPFGLNEEGESLYELKEDNDYINIPEKFEVLFKNCLIPLAMTYAISEENDENHSMYLKKYEDALVVLINYCKNSESFDRYIRI